MKSDKPGRAAVLHLDSWAGRTTHKVAVLGESDKHYKIRWEDDSVFGKFVRGVVRYVPKYCVTIDKEKS